MQPRVESEMTKTEAGKRAVLWRGDHEGRKSATPENNRFYRIFEELKALGIHAEPVVYSDDIVDDVYEQLLNFAGVLVWVDPIHEGQTRVVPAGLLGGWGAAGP